MNQDIVIFGYGPVGCATAALLAQQGRAVRIAQRHQASDLPPGMGFIQADVLDEASVLRATEGAAQIVIALGFPYAAKVWQAAWPPAMANLLAAAARAAARVVFVDNLYMYGPQSVPLVETMPLTDYGAKPAVRAALTRQWQAATGKVRFAALRAADFYGPGTTNAHLGTFAFAALARGKVPMLLDPPDTPHDFAYVPDFARGVVALLDAPDDAFGQAWHLPNAPTQTPRALLQQAADSIGVRLKLRALPFWAVDTLGLFVPDVRELKEMRFQWDRPYLVDASKFAKRFSFTPTPFAEGIAATMRSFKL